MTARLAALLDDELGLVDRVLKAAAEGKLDRESLYSLNKWRAVGMARVLCKAELLSAEERDEIARQAANESGPLRVLPRWR